MMDEAITNDELLAKGIAPDISCDYFARGGWQKTSVSVPDEMSLTIYINAQELITIMCTPAKLNTLVLGFLYSEGIIRSIKDVASMRVCEEESLADVKLNTSDFKPPAKRTITSGCGGGTVFTSMVPKVSSDIFVTPTEILSLMKQLGEQAETYRLCGGVHASTLADNKSLLVLAEDIGRHNTLDRIQGECLLRNIATRDKILIGTGRLSSEMLLKAARMAIPIVVSRSSPTKRAISLAHELGVTVVGYARASHLSVYSHPERIVPAKNG
jgi:FdhD protein